MSKSTTKNENNSINNNSKAVNLGYGECKYTVNDTTLYSDVQSIEIRSKLIKLNEKYEELKLINPYNSIKENKQTLNIAGKLQRYQKEVRSLENKKDGNKDDKYKERIQKDIDDIMLKVKDLDSQIDIINDDIINNDEKSKEIEGAYKNYFVSYEDLANDIINCETGIIYFFLKDVSKLGEIQAKQISENSTAKSKKSFISEMIQNEENALMSDFLTLLRYLMNIQEEQEK